MQLSFRLSNNALLKPITNLMLAIFAVSLLMPRILSRLLMCRNGAASQKAFATLRRFLESEWSQQALESQWCGDAKFQPRNDTFLKRTDQGISEQHPRLVQVASPSCI